MYVPRIILIWGLCSCFVIMAKAQNSDVPQLQRDNALAVGVSYGVGLPFGDLSDRFGTHGIVGGSLDLLLPNKGIVLSSELKFIFGNKVKEDVLATMATEQGTILGSDSGLAQISLRERGTYMGLVAAKIFKIKHPYSGLKLGVGFGALQHKIRIQVDTRNVSQLQDEYKKGYDRNSVGPALKQVIGYQRIGTYRSVNYSFQFEFIQGFTKNNRPINFDTQIKDDNSRFDMLINFSAKWYLPISSYKNPEEIYY